MARPTKSVQLAPAFDLTCDERVVHVDAVRSARQSLPNHEALRGLSEIFSALSDPTRLRMLAALSERELCVCDLAVTVGQSDSAISHHLRTMRSLGLVQPRREGRRVYYRLDDDHVSTLYHQALEHVSHRAIAVHA